MSFASYVQYVAPVSPGRFKIKHEKARKSMPACSKEGGRRCALHLLNLVPEMPAAGSENRSPILHGERLLVCPP